MNPSQDIPAFADIPVAYEWFFDVAQKRPRHPGYDFAYFAAFDAEWVQRLNRNHLISTQLAVASRHSVTNAIQYAPGGERPTLYQIAERVIRDAHGGLFPETHHRKRIVIYLVAHHCTAEMSILDDNDKPYVTEAISLVRKSPVTLLDPVSITLPGNCEVDIFIRDTILIAPATHRSLKKLSTLLGDEGSMKESISSYYIENMDVYLKEYPERFERYALKDTEVTLRLFFLLQDALNRLSTGKIQKIYVTIGSAAVNAFWKKNRWVRKYLKKLRSRGFSDAMRLVKRAYYGGRNEGLLVGQTQKFPATATKRWIDIDEKGAYATLLSMIPVIDLDKEVIIRFERYDLSDECIQALLDDNVPLSKIREAQAALKKSPKHFEWMLANMKEKSVSGRIRNAARVLDNSLIETWYAEWCRQKENGEIPDYLVPGVACVRFRFPESRLYPCLHVHHSHYGLIYPRSGVTAATHQEIMLAMDAGAEIEAIWSLEFPVKYDDDGLPVMYLKEFMRDLAVQRKDYKDDADKGDASAGVYEKLLKEFMNSLYGKFSQGVNPRNVCHAGTFQMKPLGPSKVTDPVVAALTTGAGRATLSSLMLAVESYNEGRPSEEWIDIASATTDGYLVGLPAEPSYSVVGAYYEEKELSYEEDF